MDPSRRGFIQGIVTGITGAVVAVKTNDANQLKKENLVELWEPKIQPATTLNWGSGLPIEVYVHDRESGAYVPFGIVDNVMISNDVVEVTSFASTNKQHVKGLRNGTFSGHITWQMPEFRGPVYTGMHRGRKMTIYPKGIEPWPTGNLFPPIPDEV